MNSFKVRKVVKPLESAGYVVASATRDAMSVTGQRLYLMVTLYDECGAVRDVREIERLLPVRCFVVGMLPRVDPEYVTLLMVVDFRNAERC